MHTHKLINKILSYDALLQDISLYHTHTNLWPVLSIGEVSLIHKRRAALPHSCCEYR